MNRKEFLEILRSQLAGQMQEGKAAAHIRYYEDYIQSQVRGGRSEQEVLQELGDPHLIAKTLIKIINKIESIACQSILFCFRRRVTTSISTLRPLRDSLF